MKILLNSHIVFEADSIEDGCDKLIAHFTAIKTQNYAKPQGKLIDAPLGMTIHMDVVPD